MKRPVRGLLAALAALVAIDQWSKLWAEAHVRGRGVITLFDGFFDLRFSRNRGAFFGIGSQLPELARRGLLVGAALVAGVWMLNLYRGSRPEQVRLRAALALLLSGAVGNMIDRIRRGEVTDFLHLHFGEVFHWATFNAADIYIAAGLVLLIPELFATEPTSGSVDAPPQRP